MKSDKAFDLQREMQVVWTMLGFIVVGCASMIYSVISTHAGDAFLAIAAVVVSPAAVVLFYFAGFCPGIRRSQGSRGDGTQRSLARLMAAAAFYVGAVGLAVGEALSRTSHGH